MTGEEYCQLTHYALSLSPNTGSSQASTVQKEGSKMLPMDCMTGESTELIVAVSVEYRDNSLLQQTAATSNEMTAVALLLTV